MLKAIEIRDIYSDEGFAALTRAYTLASYKRGLWQIPWKGVETLQFPEELFALAEAAFDSRAAAIVEVGIWKGGGLTFLSDVMSRVPDGIVVGVDIDISKAEPNVKAAGLRNVSLIEGDSASLEVVESVREACGKRRTMVILDSDHSAAHVAKELPLYADLVSEDAFLVCMDGIVKDLPDIDPNWVQAYRKDNPETAIASFLDGRHDFVRVPGMTRCGRTQAPGGYLKKIVEKEG